MLALPPSDQLRIGPPAATRPRRAAAFTRPHGVETYTVPGGGAVSVEIFQGDRCTVINKEGGQRAEIVATSSLGRVSDSVLDAKPNAPAKGIRALLSTGGPGLESLKNSLARRGIKLARARALVLFGISSPAGDEASFEAQEPGWLLVAAPGSDMDVGKQETLTPISLTITRAKPRSSTGFSLPEPLADPILDLRIASATARAYRIGKGEFFQIIDVDGRQCTDFQCFDARKVDKGICHPLDVMTTRTIQGRAYPMPGLHAKYFDQDMTPLVEVIRDTCGRHDAFALACSAKYYDDIGYPGHVNCSDNFNSALAEYGVPGRPGWMAANFFYNTGIDADGVMFIDEPWSRPGDYVMMRALTDIVCVSSACPDDTTPANGWQLTDIHVRSYAASERFSRATAWRPMADEEPIMTRDSAFRARFAELTGNFVEYRGFWLPSCFAQTDPIQSYWACREAVVVMDLSALRKFEVTGPDAEALLNWVLTRNIEKLGVGQVVYSAMCYPHGGMIDDGTLFRLGPQNFRWIGGTDEGGAWLREEAARLGLDVMVRSSTDQMHNLAVQGPNSRDLMREIIWTPPHQTAIGDLEWFRFTIGRIGGETGAPVVVSRTGYTGELGYEIFCHPKDGEKVFDAVWEAGQAHGIKPMGLAGLDLVRIEAGLVFAGYDFSDQTDPFEAGIGFTVPLKSKTADFVGREAIIRRKEHPSRKFIGLEIDGQQPVAHGDCIRIGRAQVGEICSAMRSPRTGQMIALARVDIAHSEVETVVEVGRLDGHMKRLSARIKPFPYYDPKKERPRS